VKSKTLSLCASKRLDKDEGWLQYRYGVNGRKPELLYPETPTHPSKSFVMRVESATKGTQVILGFNVGPYGYSVFTERSAFGNNGSGVVVTKHNRQISFLECSPNKLFDRDFFGTSNEELGIPVGEVTYPPELR
jgi:hypothetical protein